jgi:multidrug resistance efflux pump
MIRKAGAFVKTRTFHLKANFSQKTLDKSRPPAYIVIHSNTYKSYMKYKFSNIGGVEYGKDL